MFRLYSGDFGDVDWPGAVLTLGTFDGLHRGHRKLILSARKIGARLGLPAVLVTYDPAPAQVLRPDRPVNLIFSPAEKNSLLSHLGLHAAVLVPFTPPLARKSAAWYLREILIKSLKARHVVIGYDHVFGRGRRGDGKFLAKQSRRIGFGLTRVSKVTVFGRRASSSRIRESIKTGEMALANRLLGHTWFAESVVARGKRLGQTLGFPTANLSLDPGKVAPQLGVYLGWAETAAGELFRAMINVGHNPTVTDDLRLKIEAHLLGFHGDLYGQRLRLYFVKRIRDEKKFSSVEDLAVQLASDRGRAAKIGRASLNKIDKS